MTSPLHLIHIPINAQDLIMWGLRQTARGESSDLDYGMMLHKLLSASFGKGAIQPFRLFTPKVGQWGLYGYSAENADALRASAALHMTPDMDHALPLNKMRSKTMPAIKAGTRLGYDILTRPTRRLTSDGKTKEQDAFVMACHTAAAQPEASPPERAQIYEDWLRERLSSSGKPIATLDSFRLAHFATSRANRNHKTITGPEATFQGTLTVQDADAFANLLRHGLGRHKAYGYGMVLLRPADRGTP
ncbi:type I-E CRISPR-associated protein Cas6/Cse3/CasE [Formicincola oecophyllae]|uniref:Type I-E CRISPR-associated protein Cas6/Cse3/CasE n=1 Tax=Formicincola oecophyllae TaxID=2558361 RepID=A0A4Y6U7K8_9PROT|nr:type I-E CRISPR-associated protein Cas6/Cse3/CasE [Formicincola oecophyllae]QDH13389.1 type I-E CRISPR-associated protein Cas6/Cse3/CasE [Formicincola oecophyllae]